MSTDEWHDVLSCVDDPIEVPARFERDLWTDLSSALAGEVARPGPDGSIEESADGTTSTEGRLAPGMGEVRTDIEDPGVIEFAPPGPDAEVAARSPEERRGGQRRSGCRSDRAAVLIGWVLTHEQPVSIDTTPVGPVESVPQVDAEPPDSSSLVAPAGACAAFEGARLPPSRLDEAVVEGPLSTLSSYIDSLGTLATGFGSSTGVDPAVTRSLSLARAGLQQAVAEADAGETASALGSVRFAVGQLSSAQDRLPEELAGCITL
ncbi:MAG: hypothetical protein R2789_10695 [Microthrixaceae bacterium]